VITEVLSDIRTVRRATPASTAIAIGNLLWYNSGSAVVEPASARADQGSLLANQADFAAIFAGVSQDMRLVSETSTTPASDRTIITDGIFDCSCTSAIFTPGQLVGIDRNATTPANWDTQVIAVSNLALAIGFAVNSGSAGLLSGSAITTVRCRLTSRLWNTLAMIYGIGMGCSQGTGSKVIADGAYTVLLSDPPILSMVPTAARNITLPSEALAGAAGLEYVFTNNSGGANSVTFLGSASGSIKGNGVVPQNKTGLFWSDGTHWNGMVSA
jgi:hypothetical protein